MNKQYEIVFRRRPVAASAAAGLIAALRRGLNWAGELASDAYAAGARSILEKKEAAEDLAAERRHRRAAAQPSVRPEIATPAPDARLVSGPNISSER
ncbi:hypothetical protein GCM10008179_26500 [Hansschlegelia plantiphila]|uniref:Uncharacterized protein n=1 Tax=Hansschlegelia plantiphila TaxID=374655 RepID=A0A9W6MWN8_9HYPH|nr:hypothetical protein GCM10008179_26500 [Hansschlegelia plantiphila]